MKILLSIVLVLIFASGFAQNVDSTDFEEPRDTSAIHRIGFEIGGGMLNSLMGIDEGVKDTLTNWNSKYSPVVSFSLNINFNFKRNLKAVAGMRINISDFRYSFNIGDDAREFTENYTCLDFPLKIKYNPGNPRNGIYYFASINPTIDISKSSDKAGRLIPMKSTGLYYSIGLGYLKNLDFSHLDFSLEFRHTPLNLIKGNTSFYSTNLGYLTMYSAGIFVGFF